MGRKRGNLGRERGCESCQMRERKIDGEKEKIPGGRGERVLELPGEREKNRWGGKRGN